VPGRKMPDRVWKKNSKYRKVNILEARLDMKEERRDCEMVDKKNKWKIVEIMTLIEN
jgi:hypothetical protein